jgi:hypothetical protein
LGAGPSPLRIAARYMDNKSKKKKKQKELAALPMKVDDFQEDHERRKLRQSVGLEDPKTKTMKFKKVDKKANGGVVKMRGGGAATRGMNFNRGR